MSSQHHIIKETTDTLVQLLTDTFKDNGYKRVHVIVEAPKPDAIEGKLPAVSLYLYQLSPDWEGVGLDPALGETRRVRNPEGKVIEVAIKPPSWVRLDFLISTWAQTPEDEQLLLGLAIKMIVDTPFLEGAQLKGDSFPSGYDLPISMAGRLDEGTLARFWGSLNQPIRPAIQAWTVVPIVSDVVTPFKRVEERVIGYERLGDKSAEKEYGPENGFPDAPPEGTFVKRTE